MYFKEVLACYLILFHNCFHQIDTETLIVGGDYIKIEKAPYSAALTIECDEMLGYWTCGGSIINQRVVLTAAHCLYICPDNMAEVFIVVGNENKVHGERHLTNNYKWHQDFSINSGINDIGLAFLEKNVNFGRNIKRVALVEDTPYSVPAYVASWGFIDDDHYITTNLLRGSIVEVHPRDICLQYMNDLPPGMFCAGPIQSSHYISHGESGSPLVVMDYIQIGIASFKKIDVSRSLTLYTDVGYHYNWIVSNAKKVLCKL